VQVTGVLELMGGAMGASTLSVRSPWRRAGHASAIEQNRSLPRRR
jgi:hypothetical protein